MKSKNMDKKQLRKMMSSRRSLLSKEQVVSLSDEIGYYVIKSDLFQRASHICVYQAFRNEVCCDTIMEEAFRTGKHVYVPVTDIETKTMEFFEVFENTLWEPGAYHILEPCISKDNPILKEKALVFMPGLVFDREKHRIGYGGGYYDKYFMRHPVHTRIALCFDFQIVDTLPFEEHDILPDYIVTEKGIIT